MGIVPIFITQNALFFFLNPPPGSYLTQLSIILLKSHDRRHKSLEDLERFCITLILSKFVVWDCFLSLNGSYMNCTESIIIL